MTTGTDALFANPTGTSTDTGTTTVTTDPVSTLVGDGKKFKDVNALATGKLEADAFIERLTKENEALRKEAEKNITLESVLEAIGKHTKPKDEPLKTNEPVTTAVGDIDSRVQKILDEREIQARITKNMTMVHDVMLAKFGGAEGATKAIAAKAVALGTSPTKLRELASESPEAFLKIMDVEATKGVKGPDITGDRNTQSLGNMGSVEQGTYAWYEQLRRTNKKLYFAPKTQNQMHKDIERLGDDKFYGRK